MLDFVVTCSGSRAHCSRRGLSGGKVVCQLIPLWCGGEIRYCRRGECALKDGQTYGGRDEGVVLGIDRSYGSKPRYQSFFCSLVATLLGKTLSHTLHE